MHVRIASHVVIAVLSIAEPATRRKNDREKQARSNLPVSQDDSFALNTSNQQSFENCILFSFYRCRKHAPDSLVFGMIPPIKADVYFAQIGTEAKGSKQPIPDRQQRGIIGIRLGLKP